MKRAGAATAVSVVLALVLAGCGSKGVEIEGVGETASPTGVQSYVSPNRGKVTFPYPSNWAAINRQPPGAVTIASGGASVTLWFYGPSPLEGGGVEEARRRVLASLAKRDPAFQVSSDSVKQVAGLPAVEIRGSTEISGHPVEVRSTHVYAPVGEYVFDAFADPDDFERANSEVFEPLLEGLRIKA